MEALDQAIDSLTRCLRSPAATSMHELFAPSFFIHTPEPLLRARLIQLVKELGGATEIRVCERHSARSARIRCGFERGYTAHGELAIDDATPPRIQWLNFELPTSDADSWDAIRRDVGALPGLVSFEVRDLGSGEVILEVDRERVLGVGSVSKLLIFLTVLEAIAAGERGWSDIVTMDDRDRSLPSGLLQDWPAQAPLTLHSIVTLLISISDNTAADLLLRELGRERVESLLDRLPVADPMRNRPFCSTRGLFALIGGPEPRRREFLEGDEARRRAILTDAESGPAPDLAQVTAPWPRELDWHFSASELGNLLALLATKIVASPEAAAIFSMNQGGLGLGGWAYSAFKGGSSAGRVAFAVLLADASGRWYGISFINNTTPEQLAVESRAQLVKRAADRLRG